MQYWDYWKQWKHSRRGECTYWLGRSIKNSSFELSTRSVDPARSCALMRIPRKSITDLVHTFHLLNIAHNLLTTNYHSPWSIFSVVCLLCFNIVNELPTHRPDENKKQLHSQERKRLLFEKRRRNTPPSTLLPRVVGATTDLRNPEYTHYAIVDHWCKAVRPATTEPIKLSGRQIFWRAPAGTTSILFTIVNDSDNLIDATHHWQRQREPPTAISYKTDSTRITTKQQQHLRQRSLQPRKKRKTPPRGVRRYQILQILTPTSPSLLPLLSTKIIFITYNKRTYQYRISSKHH